MKANELRIGSIVKSLVNDEDFSIVEEIGHRASLGYYVSLNNQHSGVWLEHKERDLILPIPLTEEWLLKLGFIKHVSQSIWYTLNKVDVWFFDGKYVNDIDVEIKYVHQLQNLYFALTNEELTMK
jgi:hypothetical protein